MPLKSTTKRFTMREIVQNVAYSLDDPNMERFKMAFIVDMVNVAQSLVAVDLKYPIAIDTNQETAADTRFYHFRDDFSLDDVLGISKLWIDDILVEPLVHGMDDVDFDSDSSSNRFVGYTIEGDYLVLEPKAGDAYSIRMHYIQRPATMDISTNTESPFPREIMPLVQIKAVELCLPLLSEKRAEMSAMYEGTKGKYVYSRELVREPLPSDE